jgi:hypothetical protein
LDVRIWMSDKLQFVEDDKLKFVGLSI